VSGGVPALLSENRVGPGERRADCTGQRKLYDIVVVVVR
jgi:hypothetical protein